MGKPKDWMCPQCGDSQFARNDRCRRCGMERPPVDSSTAPPLPALAPIPQPSQPEVKPQVIPPRIIPPRRPAAQMKNWLTDTFTADVGSDSAYEPLAPRIDADDKPTISAESFLLMALNK